MHIITKLFLFFLLISQLVFSQNKKIDSLEAVLKTPIHDTEKVIIYNKLSFQYVRIADNEKALSYGKQAFELSSKLGYKRGQAKSMINIGNVFLNKSELESAEKYYSSGLVFAKQINALQIMASCSNNLGEVYRLQGNFEKALSYYLETLKVDEFFHNKESASGTLNNIGLLYQLMRNYPKAIESYKRSMEISKALNNNYVYSANLLNIAIVYFEDKKMDEALNYYQQAVALCKKINNFEAMGKALYGIGHIHQLSGKQEQAMSYYMQAMKVAEGAGDKQTIISCLNNIGVINEENGNFEKALEYEKKALDLALELGLKIEVRDSYYALVRTYAKANNAKKALEYFDLYTELNDELHNTESSKQIAEMQTKYETDQKQKENEVLAQKNQLLSQQSKIQELNIQQSRYFILGLSILSVFIIGIAFLFIRQNKMNALYAKIEMEQKLLRSQMNPHFIFNAMVGIQNYIYKEEPEVAANYLSSVVHLMRSIIDNSIKEFVILDKEISTLHHYLTLQQVRFQGKFDFTIDTDQTIDTDIILIPPMMAQPVIENAIVHGIMNKTNGMGLITINFKTLDDSLILEIEDNGIGREKAKEFAKKDDNHLSIATNITQERLKILNRNTKHKSSMTILDLKNEQGEAIGTRVTFLFPIMSA